MVIAALPMQSTNSGNFSRTSRQNRTGVREILSSELYPLIELYHLRPFVSDDPESMTAGYKVAGPTPGFFATARSRSSRSTKGSVMTMGFAASPRANSEATAR